MCSCDPYMTAREWYGCVCGESLCAFMDITGGQSLGVRTPIECIEGLFAVFVWFVLLS